MLSVIEPLIGNYCERCVESLRNFQLAKYAIVVMCPEDQDKLLRNGDMERLAALIDERHAAIT